MTVTARKCHVGNSDCMPHFWLTEFFLHKIRSSSLTIFATIYATIIWNAAEKNLIRCQQKDWAKKEGESHRGSFCLHMWTIDYVYQNPIQLIHMVLTIYRTKPSAWKTRKEQKHKNSLHKWRNKWKVVSVRIVPATQWKWPPALLVKVCLSKRRVLSICREMTFLLKFYEGSN